MGLTDQARAAAAAVRDLDGAMGGLNATMGQTPDLNVPKRLEETPGEQGGGGMDGRPRPDLAKDGQSSSGGRMFGVARTGPGGFDERRRRPDIHGGSSSGGGESSFRDSSTGPFLGPPPVPELCEPLWDSPNVINPVTGGVQRTRVLIGYVCRASIDPPQAAGVYLEPEQFAAAAEQGMRTGGASSAGAASRDAGVSGGSPGRTGAATGGRRGGPPVLQGAPVPTAGGGKTQGEAEMVNEQARTNQLLGEIARSLSGPSFGLAARAAGG